MHEWLKELLDVGSALMQSTLQHNVDRLLIRIEPEYGHVYVSAKMPDKTINKAWRFDAFPDDIRYEKVVPQEAGTSTGTGNE